MVNFIAGAINFIFKYLVQIILVILILVLVMVYMTVHNVHFKKNHLQLQRIVEIEGFLSSSKKDLAINFCKQNQTASDGGQANCNTLGYDACNMTTCCGWAIFKDKKKDKKCVAANNLGMTHRSDEEDVDSLYFQYKKVNV